MTIIFNLKKWAETRGLALSKAEILDNNFYLAITPSLVPSALDVWHEASPEIIEKSPKRIWALFREVAEEIETLHLSGNDFNEFNLNG